MSRIVKRLSATFRFTSACLFPAIISIGAIIFFLVAVLLPAIAKNNRLTRDIAQRQDAVTRQEMLAPAYATLSAQLQKVSTQHADMGPRILPAPISPEMTSPALRALVDETSLGVLSINPNPKTLSAQDGLSVDLRLTGDFMRLQDLLMLMQAQPWVLNLGSLEIKGGLDQEEFRISANVLMENVEGKP